jgi:HAD superfamily hydrolase (TIGR01549 family)
VPRKIGSSPVLLPPLVLFDMDDTLFDHTLTCRAAIARLRKEGKHLRGRSLEATFQEYGRLLNDTHADVMRGRRSSEDARDERFLRLAAWAGHPVDRMTAAALSTKYRSYYVRTQRGVAGAPEAVRRLAGRARIGIVTNNTVREQTEKLRVLHLDRAVDFLVTSEEVGVGKPDPAIFRAALERATVGPEDAVMVGDSWESDVVGARRAGIRAVWFNRFGAPRPGPSPVPEFAAFRPAIRFERLIAKPVDSVTDR